MRAAATACWSAPIRRPNSGRLLPNRSRPIRAITSPSPPWPCPGLQCLVGEKLEGRHVDLRPYILSGRDSWVTPGGLTRVALKKGFFGGEFFPGRRFQGHLGRVIAGPGPVRPSRVGLRQRRGRSKFSRAPLPQGERAGRSAGEGAWVRFLHFEKPS